MSRSKDGFYRGPRGGCVRATPHNRCPVCGAAKWCSMLADGRKVFCRHDTTGEHRVDAAGGDFWVHRAPNGYRPPADAVRIVTGTDRAAPDVLDGVYRAVLGMLTLAPGHRAELERRGLDRPSIAAGMYATLPLEGRARIAAALVERFGDHTAAGVPGLYQRVEGDRAWWTLAGSPGLLVPVVDVAGRCVALKSRRDGSGDGARYTYLSSAKRGGPAALQAVHVPPWHGDRDVVRVTEGELKAGVCTHLTRRLTISVPGVATWRAALPVLQVLGARSVRVAFDADHHTNEDVARAMHALVQALRGADYRVTLETWDPRWKGLDDYLVARRAGVAA